jgi:hypothetical protein
MKYANPHKIPNRNVNYQSEYVLGLERTYHHPLLLVDCCETAENEEKEKEREHDPCKDIFDIGLLENQEDKLAISFVRDPRAHELT